VRVVPVILVFLALVLVGLSTDSPGLVVAATAATAAEGGERWVTLEEVGVGMLLRRTDEGMQPLPVLTSTIDLEVTGPLIAGTVRQGFRNQTAEVIEAVYVFPLPERAAVDHMEMQVGRRRIVSVVQERQRARQTYARAKRSGQKAALVEGERPNLFTTSVANINPGEAIDVTIRYFDVAAYDDGVFSLAFPLTFTPRFIPPAQLYCSDPDDPVVATARRADAARVSPPFVAAGDSRFPEATIRVRLHPGLPLTAVRSASHRLAATEDQGVWSVQPAACPTPADRDFLLTWQPELGTEPRSALFVEDHDDARYALLMTVPPLPGASPAPADGADTAAPTATRASGPATETMFVIDVSGSMQGPSIVQARQALLAALDRLRPDDTFNILEFNDQSQLFRRDFQPAAEPELTAACRWVRSLRADGGTMMYPALLRAVSRFAGADATRSRRLILITDAAIGNESQLLSEVAGGLGNIRLHIVGIGNAPNRFLVRRLAELGGGLAAFVASEDDAVNGIDRFLERIGRPVMANLEVAWRECMPDETYPARLPDLFNGEPVLLAARFNTDCSPRATLAGLLGEDRITFDLTPYDTAQRRAGIATLWARRKVADLNALFYGGADPDTIRERIVAVGTRFNLVTRHTSLVAVEQVITASDQAHTRRLPSGLPAGSRLLAGKTGYLPATGTDAPLRRLLSLVLLVIGGAVWWAAWLAARRSHKPALPSRCADGPAPTGRRS